MRRYDSPPDIGKTLNDSRYLQDTPYLSPIIDEIEREMKEREDLDSMIVQKKR